MAISPGATIVPQADAPAEASPVPQATISIRGGTSLGDRLYDMLKAGVHMTNTMTLLCKDGETVRNVHEDVLHSCSPYFREILAANPARDKPLPVAVSARMIDLVIEFLYTTHIEGVEVKELVELYAVADAFQLEELATKMKQFFRESLGELLYVDSILTDRTLEEVSRFAKIFPSPLHTRDQIKLIQNIYDWGMKQQVAPNDICGLISKVLTCASVTPPSPSASDSSPERKLASPFGKARESEQDTRGIVAYCTPLFVSDGQVFQLNNGKFVDAELPPAIVEKFTKCDKACVTGNDAYIVNPNDISVFDMVTGELLRSLKLPFDWRSWCERLVVHKGRAYTWYSNEVFHLSGPIFQRMCRTKYNPTDLAVIEHTDETFSFCYETAEKQVILVTVDRKGNINSEEPLSTDNIELIGAYDDSIIVCRSVNELIVVQGGLPVWKHYLSGSIEFIFFCGRAVYIRRPTEFYVVDTASHFISTVPAAAPGHLIVREVIETSA